MTSKKQKMPEEAELDDRLLDRAAGGRGEHDRERCRRCGSSSLPLYKGYCLRCRAELGI